MLAAPGDSMAVLHARAKPAAYQQKARPHGRVTAPRQGAAGAGTHVGARPTSERAAPAKRALEMIARLDRGGRPAALCRGAGHGGRAAVLLLVRARLRSPWSTAMGIAGAANMPVATALMLDLAPPERARPCSP